MRPRSAVLWIAVVVILALLAGCGVATPVPGSSPSASTSSTPLPLASRLTRALAARDEPAFLSAFVADTHGQALGERLFANLAQFTDVTFTAVPTPSATSGVSTVDLQVSWRVPVEQAFSTWSVRFVLDETGASNAIAELVVEPQLPLWALVPIAVARGDGVAVIYDKARQDSAGLWLAAATAARMNVPAGDLGALTSMWDKSLVIEIPETLSALESLLGVASGTYRTTGAITTLAGSTPSSALHIFVNPIVAVGASAATSAQLLTHEAVHVATRSPLAKAPLWLVEGLAGSVTSASYPGVAASTTSLVRNWLTTHAVPADLPTDAALAPSANDVNVTYALAQIAVDATIARLGRPAATALMAKVMDGTAAVPSDVTVWFRDALSVLKGA